MNAARMAVIERLAGGHDDLVFRFFGMFSRFECALKHCRRFVRQGGKLVAEPDWRVANPDWLEFAKLIRGEFADCRATEFVAARAYLLRHPPKTQVLSADKTLGWEETHREPDEWEEGYVLRLVRTIRNNLFHGGKYPLPEGAVDEAARNRDLLQAGLVVLDLCLSLSPEVEEQFKKVA